MIVDSVPAPQQEQSCKTRGPPLVEEVVVESASSDSEPEKETVSEEIFTLTEVYEKKDEVIKEPTAEEIMAIKEAKEESVTPALA